MACDGPSISPEAPEDRSAGLSQCLQEISAGINGSNVPIKPSDRLLYAGRVEKSRGHASLKAPARSEKNNLRWTYWFHRGVSGSLMHRHRRMRVLRQTVHLDWLSTRGIASYRRFWRNWQEIETGELEVRGDEEMEAEENERRWRRNTPKYRLQASNWQMERNGAHMILATDADLYLRYGAPKTKSLVTNAMDAAERENAHYPNRGRAVDTTDANYPSPSIVSVCREIERWVSGVEKTKAP
ncbi:hypothetical protein K438DRAFT_1778538 [Mycena galopus ATCC 62051]|nr:hypothetical protein K438DRAFT_1778538 [Mycena galopus ATCC 62051]